MEAKFINPFLTATLAMFRDMYKLEVIAGKPYLLDRSSEKHRWYASGIIGLAGQVRGVVVISLGKVLLEKLLKDLGVKSDSSADDDISDLVGELANIIAGNAKTGLEDFRISISLPTIVSGDNHRISWPSSAPAIIAIAFSSNYGPFEVSVSFEKT